LQQEQQRSTHPVMAMMRDMVDRRKKMKPPIESPPSAKVAMTQNKMKKTVQTTAMMPVVKSVHPQ